jgi:hypothetical protein
MPGAETAEVNLVKTHDKTDIALPLLPELSRNDAPALMPGEFAGMYQAGFEAGYEKGREAGYRQGFSESIATVREGPDNGAAQQSPVKGNPAPKPGPWRMLLGMPCERCHVYLMSDETCCPCCKQMRTA